jgi:ergothioneine biosynthesis protein EgtB
MTPLAARYSANRRRSRALFELLADEAYYAQPIALRHPIVFYEGHLPAFSFNTLVKRGLGRRSIDSGLEQLFARGIDPAQAARSDREAWPAREVVQAFAAEADAQVVEALTYEQLDGSEAVDTILEHEAMHQETLLYMWHQLPHAQKRRPAEYIPRVDGQEPPVEWIDIDEGIATLGVAPGSIPFGWDNEFPEHRERVPPFRIERHDVTNARFLEFVEAGGYENPRWWRPEDWQWVRRENVTHPLFWTRDDGRWQWVGMFECVPLPPAWPVYVSLAEARAFARWSGARLPTEAEFQRAAAGAAPGLCDFASWDPHPAGSHPEGRSAHGVDDLVGNGWEWTSTPFAGFPGFRPMAWYPEYSADFFDGEHYVMKGASPATARELLRPSFRNWFRAQYPYVYATFRLARDAP